MNLAVTSWMQNAAGVPSNNMLPDTYPAPPDEGEDSDFEDFDSWPRSIKGKKGKKKSTSLVQALPPSPAPMIVPTSPMPDENSPIVLDWDESQATHTDFALQIGPKSAPESLGESLPVPVAPTFQGMTILIRNYSAQTYVLFYHVLAKSILHQMESLSPVLVHWANNI